MTIKQNLTIRLLRVLRYNKARVERAIELLPDRKKPLFQVIPFLLHINHPEFPGFIDDKSVPCGLQNYSRRDQLLDALKLIFSDKQHLIDDMRQLWPKKRHIESVLLMGSIGTIAQSHGSDFDYWVCLYGDNYTDVHLSLLQDKLSLIENWAMSEHQLEVHFFLSEIEKVKVNDFGEADGESSGSAQAIFLKGKFYTTHIVVAGKAPLWWLIPEKTTDGEYQQYIEQIREGDSPDPDWFIDLGNLHAMDPNELFGAAIWQISKGMDSPFKSVLKMAKLEVFLENISQKQPLCDLLKARVHGGEFSHGDLEHLDPYALMFDELLSHYSEAGNTQVVGLLQLCLYIKCGCPLSEPAEISGNHFERQIIQSYVHQWGWSKNRIMKVDGMKHWSFRDLSRLSRQTHSFLIMCYRRISARIEQNKQNVNSHDMTVIGRKIDTFYSRKENKIEYLRSAFDNELYCPEITIRIELDENLRRKWSMYSGNQVHKEVELLEKFLLLSAYNPLELIIWGLSNRVMDQQSKILLGYNTEPVTEEDLKFLVKHAEALFPPIKISELSREALLKPASIKNCLVVVNIEGE